MSGENIEIAVHLPDIRSTMLDFPVPVNQHGYIHWMCGFNNLSYRQIIPNAFETWVTATSLVLAREVSGTPQIISPLSSIGSRAGWRLFFRTSFAMAQCWRDAQDDWRLFHHPADNLSRTKTQPYLLNRWTRSEYDLFLSCAFINERTFSRAFSYSSVALSLNCGLLCEYCCSKMYIPDYSI